MAFETLTNREIAQEWWTVELKAPGSNPAPGEFFRAMLQRVTSDRVYKIPTKQTAQYSPYMKVTTA